MIRFHHRAAALMLAGSFLPHAALAQDVATNEKSDTDAEPSTKEIMVTGSRIVRDGNAAPTPVTVMSVEELKAAAPSNIPDALNQLPQFANSSSDRNYFQTNANEPFSGNYLNLRGIGPERSLVLLDGRRVPSTSFRGTVDTNMLPQMLVQRVDVVTAGASATYGSDAVSGVVNYVLDRNFTGIKVEGQAGLSSRADMGSQRLAIAGGTSLLDDRLHLIGSVEYFKRDGLQSRSDRKYGSGNYLLTGAGTTDSPYVISQNTGYTFTSFGGLITSGPLAGMTFQPDGAVAAFNAGDSTGTSGVGSNGDGGYWDNISLTGGLETVQAFGRASYDLTPDTSLFVQASYGHSTNTSHQAPDYRFGNLVIYADNPYLDPSVAASLGDTESFTVSRINRDFGLNNTRTTNEAINATAGLEGAFGSSWTWTAYYTYGRSQLNPVANEIENSKFYAAIGAVDDGNGNIVCRVTLTNPDLYPGCVPLNVMGEGAPSQAALDYIRGDSKYQVVNRLDNVAANIQGEPFSTWAGPVSVALGAEYRRQSLVQTSNANPAIAVDFTGLRNASGSRFNFTNVGGAEGSYDVKEVYGEVVVPLLSGSPLGDSLELNGAFRYTDYSTSGGVSTWKIGAVYQPFSSLKFRVTRSRDIRAPTLYDLYAGSSTNTNTVVDPFNPDEGVQIFSTRSSGNPDLQPEKGDTFTAGVIFEPDFLPGLRGSIDYFDLEITDAIVTTSFSQQLQDCYNAGGDAAVCDTIQRDSNGLITQIDVTPLNLAKIEMRGVDADVSYNTALGDGRLGARFLLSYVAVYKTQQSATSDVIENAGTTNLGLQANPKFRGNFQLTYRLGRFSAFVQERWLSEVKRSTLSTAVYAADINTIPDQFYTDLTLTYDVLGDRSKELFLTINNLFDKQAPLAPASSAPGLIYPTIQSTYDITGAYGTIGFRMKL